ncbi:MAG: NAD-dependent epimerase/dehydratase family protein [Gemmatimonadota bacterium]
MPNVLVLGAAGAIGAHAVRALLAEGWRVRALARAGSDLRGLDGLPLELVRGDLRDSAALARALEGCAALVHAAGAYPTSRVSVAGAIAAGLAGVEPPLEAARAAGVVRAVYVSSLSTIGPARRARARHGRPPRAPALVPLADERDEGAWPHEGAYSAAKRAMEAAALSVCVAGLPLVVVNPTLCLGEHDHKPTSGRMVHETLRGRLPLLDAPLNVVYTGDVGLGIARALERGRPGERYLLGGANTTAAWLLRQIAFEGGVPPPRLWLPMQVARRGAHAADVARRLSGRPAFSVTAVDLLARGQHFDCGKARRELGLPEATSAVETVRRAVAWFQRSREVAR